jgi:hypothetical protein
MCGMILDYLHIINYYDINEHKQNGVDEEEYILTRSIERRWSVKIFMKGVWK